MLLVYTGPSPGVARDVFVSASLVSLVLALALPLGARWRHARDPGRQARLVEDLAPDLRGRLVTAAERLDGPRPGESEVLLARARNRAAHAVRSVPREQVHPARLHRRLLAADLVAALLAVLLGTVGPLGPVDAVARLLRTGAGTQVEAPASPGDVQVATALVGDIVLRYLYPAYTRLDPVVVANSTGEVHGPPGTRVEIQARTGEAWDAARLQTDLGEEKALLVAVLAAGRDVTTGFQVSKNGTWTLLLERSGEEGRSPAYPIVVEPDLPPEVLVEAPTGALEVAWDQPLPLRFTARDDYGIVRVDAVAARGNQPTTRNVTTPLDPSARLEGALRLSPRDLGLRPGDDAVLKLLAWDNDDVSGSKAGESRALHLRVMGPQGQSLRRARLVRELRDVLLVLLADHLEQDPPWASQPLVDDSPNPDGSVEPVSIPLNRPARGEVARLGEALAARVEPLEELVRRTWDGFDAETFEGTVVSAVRKDQTTLAAFLRSVGEPGSEEAITEDDTRTLVTLRNQAVRSLEQGILTLDDVVRMMAMAELTDLAKQVAKEATDLADRKDASAPELLARLDRLERSLERLRRAAEDLSAGEVAEFVNSRVADSENLLDEIRKAIAEGRMDEARELMDRLARQLQELSQHLQDMSASKGQASEDLARQLEALQQGLAALEKEERDLAGLTADLQQRFGGDVQALADRWEELRKRAEALAGRLEGMAERMAHDPNRRELEARLGQDAAENARNLEGALSARDLARARERAEETEWSTRRLRDLSARLDEQYRSFDQPRPDDPDLARDQREATAEAEALRRALDELDRRLSSASPQMRQAAEELADRQRDVRERTASAAQQAEQLAGELPMNAPGLAEAVRGAEGEMQRAEDDLRDARPTTAEGAQRLAADKLAEAQRALQRARDDARDMARFAQGQGEEGEEQASKGKGQERGDRQGRDGSLQPEEWDLPAPGEFRTPEAYRKALLEGMSADVPQEFEALKRRYYEELVRQ